MNTQGATSAEYSLWSASLYKPKVIRKNIRPYTDEEHAKALLEFLVGSIQNTP